MRAAMLFHAMMEELSRELPHLATMIDSILRPHDIPKSFYPGMWLREAEEGVPYADPTAEVVTVGRTRVSIREAGTTTTTRMTIAEAKKIYRKVYESKPPENLPEWIKEGADFRTPGWDTVLRICRIRWSCASVETASGVLLFWKLAALAKKAEPRRSTWERLIDEDPC